MCQGPIRIDADRTHFTARTIGFNICVWRNSAIAQALRVDLVPHVIRA